MLAALVASGAADGFGPVTLSFAVLRVTGSVSRLGLVLATQATMALALTLAGGLAADRFPRARVLTVSLAGRTAAAALLAAALLAGAAVSLQAGVAGAAQVTGKIRRRGALRMGWGEFVRIRWLWLLTGQWLVFSMAAIDLVGSEGGQPVGYALAGPLAAAVGAHAFLTASAALMALAGTAFAFLPALRAAVPDRVDVPSTR